MKPKTMLLALVKAWSRKKKSLRTHNFVSYQEAKGRRRRENPRKREHDWEERKQGLAHTQGRQQHDALFLSLRIGEVGRLASAWEGEEISVYRDERSTTRIEQRVTTSFVAGDGDNKKEGVVDDAVLYKATAARRGCIWASLPHRQLGRGPHG